jgi:dUTP pyrophosphatase
MVEVKVKKLSETAKLPLFSHETDACADIYANEDYALRSHEVYAISTGLKMEIPVGYEIQVRPRSGLALRNGIGVLNSPGTIDADYRGEVKIILFNMSKNTFEISKGDRIAQIAVRPVPIVSFVEVEVLSNTSRGEGGFGSTGIK